MRTSCLVWTALFVLTCAAAAHEESGTAVIKGTKEGSPIAGKVSFKDSPGGLRVSAKLSGVPPGRHGFHIHELGNCGDTGKAAGGHFNPDGLPHGNLIRDGIAHAHAGDLGNIEIAADGTGKLNAVVPNLSLSGGKYGVGGRTVILHEKEDDFSQPTGNAGGRIGCGKIVVNGQ